MKKKRKRETVSLPFYLSLSLSLSPFFLYLNKLMLFLLVQFYNGAGGRG